MWPGFNAARMNFTIEPMFKCPDELHFGELDNRAPKCASDDK
jgi:hypothetical protein